MIIDFENKGGGSSGGGVKPVDPSELPDYIDPNTIYDFGTLNSDIQFPPLKDSDVHGNVYCWFFWIGTSVPNITLPLDIVWYKNYTPVWETGKYYEITVMNNIATYLEY